ncbi:MAG: hypothetical protein LKE30_01680 [Bacteroidales bacterium]|nr:hypothetical protein [Bacteroidales bacterium]
MEANKLPLFFVSIKFFLDYSKIVFDSNKIVLYSILTKWHYVGDRMALCWW